MEYNADTLDFSENNLNDVGDGAVAMIASVAENTSSIHMSIRRNKVTNPVAGTPNFCSLQPVAKTGNRIEENNLPSGLKNQNETFLDRIDAIVTLGRTGIVLTGIEYEFAQGSLDIANNDGFLIGGNLDISSPECSLGDIVLVSADTDIKGCLVSPYVQEAGKIRIRVQNVTGAGVSIAAATWKVTVMKRT